MTRQADPGTVDADNPWPGLAAFREEDRDLFHGREEETQELLRLALRERLTVLFGLSGLGKTSLLRAGLFPLLRLENVLPIYIRLDFSDEGIRRTLAGQIRQAIASEASAAGIEAPAFPESETLWESLHRQGAELWSPRNRIVTPLLVFDQFEEVFTLGRGNTDRAQEAEAFLTELADLCEGGVPAGLRARLEADPEAARELSFTRHPYKILLSLREDFLPELEGLRGRIRSIVHNRYRLRRMNGGDALRVIAEAGGHLVEPDVPERIVRFVAGRKSESEEIPLAGLDVEPALLSVVCRELNNKRRAQGLPRITAGLVQGNRDEILSDLYERSIEDLGPEVRSFIEERLLTKSGFRDSVALENAIEVPGVTREALDKLTDRRLLRIEDRGGMPRLELAHDVLTGVIRKSRDRRLQLLDVFHSFAGDWRALADYIERLPGHLRNLPIVQEQRALVQAKTGSTLDAAGALEELIRTHGPTSEREALLGGRYKTLYRKMLQNGEPREAARYLDLAIDHYTRGMKLDLNNYYPASNLPRLLRMRWDEGDEERAKAASYITMVACERATELEPGDPWLKPSLLGAAFDSGDAVAAERLYKQILREGPADWQLETTIWDLESSIKLHQDEDTREKLTATLEKLKALIR